MFTVIIQKEIDSTPPRVLTIAEKKILTDLFATGLSIDRATRKSNLPSHLVRESYNHKRSINQKAIELMRDGYVYSEEESHIDEDTGETIIDKEAVIKNIGVVTTLKTQVKKFFPDCDKEAFDYNIDMIVKWCDGKGEATWTDFYNALKTV
jgi:hypothetical protein